MKEYSVMAEYAGGSQCMGMRRSSRESALHSLPYLKKHNPTAVRFYLVSREVSDWQKTEVLEEDNAKS